MRKQPVGFEVSLSARDDGTVEAMYVQISDNPVAETRELDEDILLGDYDEKGELVGIEILAPVSLDALLAMVDPSRRESLARVLRNGARELVVS